MTAELVDDLAQTFRVFFDDLVLSMSSATPNTGAHSRSL
jgi:hypothetical protein